MSMYKDIKYPIDVKLKLFDRIVQRVGIIPAIFCPVCGNIAPVVVKKDYPRESYLCLKCRSLNRQRQLTYVLCRSVATLNNERVRCLKDFISDPSLIIYNTECRGAIHNNLSKMKNYICSEYYGPQYKSGEIINGILHEDLMNLSFADETINVILSSDVLEHISRPYDAHREIWRVLKKNGKHIFTIPFSQKEFIDKARATHDENGELSFIEKPIYHGDPLRPEGCLVYTDFALEMLVKLRKIGFRTNMYHLYKPWYGILGPDAIVFEAMKE